MFVFSLGCLQAKKQQRSTVWWTGDRDERVLLFALSLPNTSVEVSVPRRESCSGGAVQRTMKRMITTNRTASRTPIAHHCLRSAGSSKKIMGWNTHIYQELFLILDLSTKCFLWKGPEVWLPVHALPYKGHWSQSHLAATGSSNTWWISLWIMTKFCFWTT